MADSQSSSVSIVAIIAILILVGGVLYFLFMRSQPDEVELRIDVTSQALPEVVMERPARLLA